MEYSILQSVYFNDRPEYIEQALKSLSLQTIQSKHIVLVRDGKIKPETQEIIEKWKDILPIEFVGYDDNRGLSFALNYGLKYCNTELIGRMDSDDICYNDRFERQLEYFKKNQVSLLSGWIDEFLTDPYEIVSTRKVPANHNDIVAFLKKRNAFNHMAVMFRKSDVLAVGGYANVPYFEDYDLWIRLVQSGFIVANIQQSLVKARIGNNMIGRRHGFAYAKHELNFLKRQRNNGFLRYTEYIKLILCRVPVRFMPRVLLHLVYKLLRNG